MSEKITVTPNIKPHETVSGVVVPPKAEISGNKVINTSGTGIRISWAGNDEAGDMSQPRAFGAAEASTEVGADQESRNDGIARGVFAVPLAVLVVIGLASVVARFL